MLEARFPRIWGDMGNAQTFPFPVRYKVVRSATPALVVRHQGEGMLDAFIEAGQELVADACAGITANCGFLTLFQDELSAALAAPVMTSVLMQAGMIQSLLPTGRRMGILTIPLDNLTPAHLTAAHVPEDCPVMGEQEGCHFQTVILNGGLNLNIDQAQEGMIAAATRLVVAHPDIRDLT